MPVKAYCAVLLAVVIAATGFGPASAGQKKSIDPLGEVIPENMTLTLFQDFRQPLDMKVWSHGWPRMEVNRLGDKNGRPDRLLIPDTIGTVPEAGLRITCNKGAYKDSTIDTRVTHPTAFLCGSVHTAEKFSQRYGRFEVKAKMPKGQGVWPSFWMVNQTGPYSEIDVFEYLGKYKNQVHVGYFYNSTANNIGGWTEGCTAAASSPLPPSASCGRKIPDLSDDYHVYTLDWRPDAISFLFDGKVVFTGRANVPQNSVYILLTQLMGGAWGGEPDTTTPWPSRYDIAWLRVYQYKDLPAESPKAVVLAPVQVSSAHPARGETVTISTTVRVTDPNVTAVSVSLTARTFDNKVTMWSQCVTTDLANPRCAHFTNKSGAKVGKLVAGETYNLSYKWTVPQTISDGIYRVSGASPYYIAEQPGSAQTRWVNSWLDASTFVTVGQPAHFFGP